MDDSRTTVEELDKEMCDLLEEMHSTSGKDPAYKNMAESAKFLAEASKNLEEAWKTYQTVRPPMSFREWFLRCSPDTPIALMGSIAMELLILNYERFNIIKSKAFGLIPKVRV